MSATERIRHQMSLFDLVDDRGQVLVERDDAEALCDLAELAKRIHPSLDAVAMLLKDHNCRVTASAFERFHDDLGEILSRLEDKE